MLDLMEPPPSREVHYLNQVRQMLILLRAMEKSGLHPEETVLEDLHIKLNALYMRQRNRCGYPPIRDPLTPQRRGFIPPAENKEGI